ncbi:MAG TPA: type IV pilus twitching motility protein PilT [Candidatus Dormibacteraeota bacterium]|nr:type IV pilus twitching motility protein PilT [Candidatus Dormibacteraeota bacterium]
MAVQIQPLLQAIVNAGASDLHVSTGMPPIARLRGEMVPLQAPPLDPEQTRQALHELLTDAQRAQFAEQRDLDFALEIPGLARFRANFFEQRRGMAAVFRVISSKIPTLEQLGTPRVLKDLALRERGLVLVTGPTGSGKSSTLAAMIDHVNETCQKHIITIEDPIEFVHQPKKCLINQREVGAHTESFSAALRGALREDPDVMLVGELRDLETTSLAITAAETGHLVFGTLHTNSAAKTIDRLIDVFPTGQQAQVRTMLSESLEGVVAQTLIPTADKKGRVAAFEILVGVNALRNLIREDKTSQIQSVIQVGAAQGMMTLDQSLKELVISGKITRDEALARSTNPKLFEQGVAQASDPSTLRPRPKMPVGAGSDPSAR